ncbi:hypothetical protein FRX31_023006 [Thalictrum thalictroides]|uniref:Transmembrane protein n=1 Tax=Thalictrum thalictroides TaxID=46969 RepID=A0A7J6VQP4_THATH|nr:hypothetical protein FRX31_023006 [Thalictrum thalictroides]
MEEEREGEEISQVLNGWEPIPSSQPSLRAHSSSLQQQQPQVQAQTREWEMVEHRRNEDDDDYDFSVFPPSNHEGLHIPSHHQQQEQEQLHQVAVVEQYSPPLLEPPPPPPQTNVNFVIPTHREPLLDSIIDAKEMLIKNLRSGVQVISSNIFRLVSLGRYYYAIARRRRPNWSSSVYLGGFSFTLALLMSFWFFKWKRWRRQSREEKIDQLFQLVRHQDEKINQLLDQISYLNKLLAGRRRIPILNSD